VPVMTLAEHADLSQLLDHRGRLHRMSETI
jgi:hypothetical protein